MTLALTMLPYLYVFTVYVIFYNFENRQRLYYREEMKGNIVKVILTIAYRLLRCLDF